MSCYEFLLLFFCFACLPGGKRHNKHTQKHVLPLSRCFVVLAWCVCVLVLCVVGLRLCVLVVSYCLAWCCWYFCVISLVVAIFKKKERGVCLFSARLVSVCLLCLYH